MDIIEKPNFIFINLQETNFLVNTYSSIKSGWKVKTYKHRFLLEYLIKNDYKICNYIISTNKNIEIIKKECEIVYENNSLSGKIANLYDDSEIKPNDILIVYFHYREQYLLGKNINCFKICMGNHFIKVSEKYDLYKDGYDAFVNEVDLSKNEFVNHFFNVSNVNNLICPYIYAERFVNKIPFQDRKNRAMAVGTLSTCADIPEYSGYRDFYKTDWIQPMRYEIYKHKNKLKKIDSYISYIYEGILRIKPNDYRIIKILKKIYNKFHKQQSKYTSFDMVDKFNEYKMFVCPEELVGMPGIGFVEGMACGTAYIGLDHDMYRCLGLHPGVHYISYDGTLEGLEKTITYYQHHQEELEKIAKTGCDFVRENFNEQAVAKKFINNILKLEKVKK